jgi:hypothetical protein
LSCCVRCSLQKEDVSGRLTNRGRGLCDGRLDCGGSGISIEVDADRKEAGGRFLAEISCKLNTRMRILSKFYLTTADSQSLAHTLV